MKHCLSFSFFLFSQSTVLFSIAEAFFYLFFDLLFYSIYFLSIRSIFDLQFYSIYFLSILFDLFLIYNSIRSIFEIYYDPKLRAIGRISINFELNLGK